MQKHLHSVFIHARAHFSIIAFISGFLLDLFTLNRIDQKFTLVQQSVFLVLILVLIGFELRQKLGGHLPTFILKYKTYALHFLFGALLSAFLIFYFLSASGFTAFIFITIILGLMLANETPYFQKLNIPFKIILFSICLIAYLSYLVPTIIGYLGLGPVLLASLIFVVIMFFYSVLLTKLTNQDEIIQNYIIKPSVCTLVVFLGLYFLKAIPPVPVSIKKIGIYRSVEKHEQSYLLSYARPWYKFWQSHEAEFSFQPGDKVFCFASIFSPTQFNDNVLFEWQMLQNNKWKKSDQLTIKISGGRHAGFRAFTFKQNVPPGKWRIKILTLDQREIGRITFKVKHQTNNNPIHTLKY